MGRQVDLVVALGQLVGVLLVVQELAVKAMQAVIQVLMAHLGAEVAEVARVRLVVLAVICLEMGAMG
jgi:hypothetical protein